MINMFSNDLFTDYLTGLPNFFKFIESNIPNVFGVSGSIIIFDVIAFEKTNKKFGRDFGDYILVALSKIILNSMNKSNANNIFRTDGDEFTIILQDVDKISAKKLVAQVQNDFKAEIKKDGFGEINVRYLVLEYNKNINSINDFYNLIFKHTINELKDSDKEFANEKWIENIISSFTKRIKDTVSYFTDARNLALTDDISKLPNNRAAKIYLDKLIENNKENKKQFSILFIDGDNLKRYNNLSYETGNNMIEKLSNIIQNSLRKEDKIFRWLSGDEFLVILDNTTCEDMFKLAENIRIRVEENTKKWIYPVTISIGASNYPIHDNSIDSIINKAEKANHKAKKLGKNKVIVWNAKALC